MVEVGKIRRYGLKVWKKGMGSNLYRLTENEVFEKF